MSTLMTSAGYLLDTNIVSEGRRPRPDPRVLAFVGSIDRERLFVSVLTIGELRKGAEIKGRKNAKSGQRLHMWIDEVERAFGDRILPVDLAAARLWGELLADRPRSVVDTLLAATAICRELTLVTRNVRDVADIKVGVINPWN
jgi:predicted nucleic acid-binding protein